MRFVNDLCTDSIESIILFVNGDHTDELYSNRGRTSVLNARIRFFTFLDTKQRCIKFARTLALCVIEFMCS